MADSTTNLDLISSSQASKEVTANALFDASSPSALYGRRSSTTTALTWGYYGGRLLIAGVPTAVANGTVVLTASNTNYVVANRATGAVSVSTATTNWNDTPNYMRLYQIVAGASTVTSYVDHRAFLVNDLAFALGVNTGNAMRVDQAPQTWTRLATTALGNTSVNGVLTNGGNNVTAFTGTANVTYHVRASGNGILVHSATMNILQGAANITTANGDTFDVEMITGNTCYIKNYVRTTGGGVALGIDAGDALQADQAPQSWARLATTALGNTSVNGSLTNTGNNITTFTGVANVTYHVRATGNGVIVHNASVTNVLQGAANITTAAGDTFDVEMVTANTCNIKNYVFNNLSAPLSMVSLLPTVASAATPDIFGAAGATINYTGNTTATGIVTCAAAQVGSVKRLIVANGASFNASANMTVDSATSGSFLMAAGAEVEVLALSATTFRVTTIDSSGTFTPTLTLGGGSTGITYSSRAGRFTKKGNVVNFNIEIVLTSKGTSTGNAFVANLPFQGAAGYYSPCTINADVLAATVTSPPAALVVPATSTISVINFNGGSYGYLTDAHLGNSSAMRFSGCYSV